MKRALVTGGSGSIGKAICLSLVRQGHFIYVHANSNLTAAKATVEEIRSSGGQAGAICFDLTDREQTQQAVTEMLSDGEIQILINNAGIHDDAPMAGMNHQQWQNVIDTSLNGFFNITQPILLPMMSTRWGRIISISSIAAITGNRGQANYAAAKSALHGASKSLAIEIASRGVTVNVVAPGIIQSAMTEQIFSKDLINKMVPMKRAGSTAEVASLVSYLCSDEAGYISGQVISINGAMA